MATWVYIQSEPGLWTVGFYGPDGRWQTDSDHDSRESAAARVHYLNGGKREDDGGSYSEYLYRYYPEKYNEKFRGQ